MVPKSEKMMLRENAKGALGVFNIINIHICFQVPFGGFKFFCFIAYLVVIITQVSMYCWWGNVMILESMGVADAAMDIYKSEEATYVTKTLILIILRSQRPLYVTAGKFVPLSLNSLVGVSNYTFFSRQIDFIS